MRAFRNWSPDPSRRQFTSKACLRIQNFLRSSPESISHQINGWAKVDAWVFPDALSNREGDVQRKSSRPQRKRALRKSHPRRTRRCHTSRDLDGLSVLSPQHVVAVNPDITTVSPRPMSGPPDIIGTAHLIPRTTRVVWPIANLD